MGKVYNYMFITVGLLFLLQIAGIPTGVTYLQQLLGFDNGITNFASSDYFSKLNTIFLVGAAATIAIGFFTRGQTETFIISTLCGFLLTLISSTYASIINYVSGNYAGYVAYLISAIFIPYIAAFGLALISYWRGGDG